MSLDEKLTDLGGAMAASVERARTVPNRSFHDFKLLGFAHARRFQSTHLVGMGWRRMTSMARKIGMHDMQDCERIYGMGL